MANGASYAARGSNTAISPHRGSTTRSQKDLEELQRNLTSDEGIGERIICDLGTVLAHEGPLPHPAKIL
jgi:hypothetical protein